jgi:ligand-binding SRPBCC domain-containing protein
LLFGFIPIDIHHIHFKQLLENGFKESSNSILMKEWSHNRVIENLKQGCLLIDEISFSTRIPFLGAIIKPIYLLVFRHRHERLKMKFGCGC